MSSHREAPEISKDPAADNTDVYAFVSPDKPDTVTLVANFIPFQNPDGGPNFYAFGKDVLYEIHIHNKPITAPGQPPDITYQFRFIEDYKDSTSFLYNLGTVGVNGASGLDTYPNLNRRQTYTVTKVVNGVPAIAATDVPVPPCNVGIHSTPNYTQYIPPALKTLPHGETVFAGQRADPFFVDLGAVFDLADLRPLQFLHTGPLFPAPGVESFQGLNVFTIAIQIPMNKITSNATIPGHTAADIMDPNSVIGVYASASRQSTMRVPGSVPTVDNMGPFAQVSRLANPLFNELLIGIGTKDTWNSQSPTNDATFAGRVLDPELGRKLPALYPLAFRNLANYNARPAGPNRQDLAAILLTGIPGMLNGKPVIPGFQNFTGTVQADLLRLNMAIPVTQNPNGLGLLARDLQGFPNGRRPNDDVATIELRALLGETLPLTDPTFNTDVAVFVVSDYAPNTNGGFMGKFPYLAEPSSGFATMPRPYATGN